MGKTSDAHIANITRLLTQATDQYAAARAVQKDINTLSSAYHDAEEANDVNRYREVLGKQEKMLELVQVKLRACLALKGQTDTEITKFEAFLNKKDKDTKVPWKKTSLKASRDFVTQAKTGLKCIPIF